ncbi:MAG: ArsA-related P-loop ATPase [Desulfurococcaceae archaeon]
MEIFDAIGSPGTRPHLVIVIGKGGVGKTTVSLLAAVELSRQGPTLLLSLDPARHASKYLGIGDKDFAEIGDSLHVRQISIDKEVGKITSEHAETLREVMPYLAVLNLESIIDVVKYFPGVEEEIFLRKMLEALQERYDFVVIDTPPTGITLRTLVLPRLYLLWIDKLIEVRERIVSLRYVISRTLGKDATAHDRVLTKLARMREDYSALNRALSSSDNASYIIVSTPEPLPMHELRESLKFLAERLGVKPRLLVLNKILPQDIASRLNVEDAQNQYISEISKLSTSYMLIEYLGSSPETLQDVLKMREKSRLYKK